MDQLVLALLTTSAGAILGGLGTWWFEQWRDARQDERSLRDKVHDLELRIVRLEAEFVAANRIAERVVEERNRLA